MVRSGSSFDIPMFNYFEHNAFFGSNAGFRFQLKPLKEEKALVAEAWTDGLCRELCTVTAEEQFPLSPEGLEEALGWLEEQFSAYRSAHPKDRQKKEGEE